MGILHPGQLVRETYLVERLLGEGAFAEVYRVKHSFLGRQAMKVFKAAGGTLGDIKRDITEALLLSRMKHPNIVEVYDANVLETEGGRFGYFTMTHMAGGSLEAHRRSCGGDVMTVEDAVDITVQICRGLAVAHLSSPPIVHRDVKPQNVLVAFDTGRLHARLGDFGLAKAVNPLSLLLTSKGTLAFKPPESLLNVDSCTGDVWAVGTTLYQLLTGRLPYPALEEQDPEAARRFLEPARAPSVFNAGVDRALERILDRCLAMTPAERYANAHELLGDLERWKQAPLESELTHCAPTERLLKRSTSDRASAAERMVVEAMTMARDTSMLATAADHLDAALHTEPALRERYQRQLELWRRGIAHVSVADLKSGSVSRR